MGENDLDSTVIRGRIIDNMSVVDEYTTSMLATKVGLTEAELEPYLEALAEDDRIRKREKGSTTKWVRFR